MSTFTRVNSVVVFGSDVSTDTGRYLDPSFATTGSPAASTVVPVVGTIASSGQCWRGMPIGQLNGYLVPISASGAAYAGVLVDDVSAYVVAKGVKVTFAKRGRVRSYAGGALTNGAWVKADTSANFGGFVAWVQGTDNEQLRVGRAYPLDDGSASNGASVASTMAAGDTIFVDLIGGA